jgi:hypothetical protein
MMWGIRACAQNGHLPAMGGGNGHGQQRPWFQSFKKLQSRSTYGDTISQQLYVLAHRIDVVHNPLFDTTKFKIIRHVPIHVNILLKRSFLINAINSFGNCFGILLDFSCGIGAPLLTCIFHATLESSYYTANHVQSRIIEANALKINLRPTKPDIPTPPAHSLRTPPSLPTLSQGRGRGRGRGRVTSSSHTQPLLPSTSNDRSSTIFRIAKQNPIALHSQLVLKHYLIINGAGGIAGAGVFQLNFNNEGVRAPITNVPFNIHKSFHTEAEAWSYLTSFYPHVHSPADAAFMNAKCPKEASNLPNPSQRVREVLGLSFCSQRNITEFFYYDNPPDNIKATLLTATTRMLDMGLHPCDDYTFLPVTPTIAPPPPATTTPSTAPTSPPFSSPPPPLATVTPTPIHHHT